MAVICSETKIEGIVNIGIESILHPTCSVIASQGYTVALGERNIIEERSLILNSVVGHGNLIEVGTQIIDSMVCS